MHVSAVLCNFIQCYYDSTCYTYTASSILSNFTKGCFTIDHYNHCKTICEIPRYAVLSNSVKRPCNTPYFSISGLLQKQSLNQSRYRKIWSVTWTFYSVRQSSSYISVFHISFCIELCNKGLLHN